MARRGKVIISCAVTGSIHVPSQSPHLPLTPAQIAESAIGAAEAGAAILHLHARDPETGRPTPDPDVFARFLPQIKENSDVVINITTGGGHGMTVEERTRAANRFEPELCSLNMGSMNFGLFPVLDRVSTFEHAWEPEYLEMTRDFIFRNTYKDIETIVRSLGAVALGSSSSVTTLATSTTSPTSSSRELSSRRYLFRRSSESLAGSALNRRTCCT